MDMIARTTSSRGLQSKTTSFGLCFAITSFTCTISLGVCWLRPRDTDHFNTEALHNTHIRNAVH